MLAFYSAGHLNTVDKITLSIIFLGSLYFLASALTSKQDLRNRQQRFTAITGGLALLYGGLELYWHIHVSLLQSYGVVNSYYFASHLVGGISVATLFYVVSPRNTKLVLVIAGLLFVAFNLFVLAHYNLMHLASKIRFVLLWNGLFIGLATTSTILHWLDLDEAKKNNKDCNRGTSLSGTTLGN